MLVAFAVALFAPLATAQQKGRDLEGSLNFDGLVSAKELAVLAEQPATLQLMKGAVITESRIIDFIHGRDGQSIQFVQYADGARQAKKRARDIYRMQIGGTPYTLRYNVPTDGFYLINRQEAEAEARSRISGQRRELRDPQTDQEIEAAVGEQKEFFNEARRTLGSPSVAQYESQFALLLTDYPEPVARQLSQYIDQMCNRMNALFGIPEGANIWHGKVLVVLFHQRPLFARFESEVLDNHNYGTATTIYHSTKHGFVVVCRREKIEPSLAKSLCWSLSGGYINRYRSNVEIPEWLSVGMRQWLTASIFPDQRDLLSTRKQAATQLKQTGSLLGILSATDVGKERVGMTRLLVSYLIGQNSEAFSQFFEDIKLGQTWEKALATNYGATPQQLAASFGRTLGALNVTP